MKVSLGSGTNTENSIFVVDCLLLKEECERIVMDIDDYILKISSLTHLCITLQNPIDRREETSSSSHLI